MIDVRDDGNVSDVVALRAHYFGHREGKVATHGGQRLVLAFWRGATIASDPLSTRQREHVCS